MTTYPADLAGVQLQALAAHLYEIDAGGFAHILGTFPLVDPRLRQATMTAFTGTV